MRTDAMHRAALACQTIGASIPTADAIPRFKAAACTVGAEPLPVLKFWLVEPSAEPVGVDAVPELAAPCQAAGD